MTAVKPQLVTEGEVIPHAALLITNPVGNHTHSSDAAGIF